MKSLYKVNFDTGHSTYVVAEDLNTASSIAEKAAVEIIGCVTSKIVSVEIIATEGRRLFINALHIAPEAQPESTYDGPLKAGGLYS